MTKGGNLKYKGKNVLLIYFLAQCRSKNSHTANRQGLNIV